MRKPLSCMSLPRHDGWIKKKAIKKLISMLLWTSQLFLVCQVAISPTKPLKICMVQKCVECVVCTCVCMCVGTRIRTC